MNELVESHAIYIAKDKKRIRCFDFKKERGILGDFLIMMSIFKQFLLKRLNLKFEKEVLLQK